MSKTTANQPQAKLPRAPTALGVGEKPVTKSGLSRIRLAEERFARGEITADELQRIRNDRAGGA
jgi:hypothetical protein